VDFFDPVDHFATGPAARFLDHGVVPGEIDGALVDLVEGLIAVDEGDGVAQAEDDGDGQVGVSEPLLDSAGVDFGEGDEVVVDEVGFGVAAFEIGWEEAIEIDVAVLAGGVARVTSQEDEGTRAMGVVETREEAGDGDGEVHGDLMVAWGLRFWGMGRGVSGWDLSRKRGRGFPSGYSLGMR